MLDLCVFTPFLATRIALLTEVRNCLYYYCGKIFLSAPPFD